jgi:hypothetical protein
MAAKWTVIECFDVSGFQVTELADEGRARLLFDAVAHMPGAALAALYGPDLVLVNAWAKHAQGPTEPVPDDRRARRLEPHEIVPGGKVGT